MRELQEIESALRKAAQRRRWHSIWRGLWQGLLAGGSLWLGTLLAFKLLPLAPSTLVAGAIASGAVVVIIAVAAGFRRISLSETARWIDDRKQLQERLSTALEVASSPNANEEWKRLVIADAARCVSHLDTRSLLPLSFPQVGRWALLILVLTAGLGFVPKYRSKEYVQKQADQANIRETGKNLAELMRHSLEQRPPSLATTEKAMESVAELGERLERVPLTRGEALRDLASLTDKVSQQARELGETPGVKSLERAAREKSGSGAASAQALQKKMEALQQALGKAAGQEDKLEQMQKSLEDLKKKATELADKDSAAGAAARAEMAKALSELSQAAKALGADLPALDQAIAALEADQTDLFLSDLKTASTDLEKLKQMAQAMSELQQQSEKRGKDLAEQLEKGQAEAAQGTLARMIEQLKSPGLSSERLAEILKEVAAAAKPGSEYGKVGEHLKEAAEQLKKGDQTQAAESLAEATKELSKLMQQMADAQDLDAALDALSRAQNAIASKKSWSQAACSACQGAGCALCRGKGHGWSHGGKPGTGVGTWADETGWTYFEQSSERIDNSGITRPEMDPRGVTDRGEGELNPNLLPDKVRGQLSPGGSMPSIPLKGVSIKGQSSVQYEEAAAAAQADAKSALNQDQVPRRYRGAVRDYFDDLKK